jgi:hypothetical protein
MAGEGLDTVNVSEVVHLNAAGVNNSNNQENGRAARYLPDVLGHINFDGCSGYATHQYTGHAIMDAMDCMPASQECGRCGQDPCTCHAEELQDSEEWYELPDEPEIRIHALECYQIDSGDETVQMMIDWAIRDPKVIYTADDFKDPGGEATHYMIECVKQMRRQEANALDEKSIVMQWSSSVESAVSVIAGNVIRLITKKGVRIERSMAGDIRKRINGMKKRQCGPVEKDVDVLKSHYQWLKSIEAEMKRTGEIPSWLA